RPDTVLIGGGDGTIIEAINYFVKHGYKGAFGIIPLGTSNYLARNLKIPISLSGSLDKIAKGREKSITLPEVNGKSFALMTMIGISTEISDNVEVSLKQKLGQFAYIIETFKHLRHHESFNY